MKQFPNLALDLLSQVKALNRLGQILYPNYYETRDILSKVALTFEPIVQFINSFECMMS